MKRLLITTALISLVAVGSATADITSDLTSDLLYGSTVTSEANFNNMPATAAGKASHNSEMKMSTHDTKDASSIPGYLEGFDSNQ